MKYIEFYNQFKVMSFKRNATLVVLALTMTIAMWMIPQSISAESHKQRLLLTTYNTNSVRIAGIAKYCAQYSDRSQLVSDSQKATSQGYKDQLAATFKVNGNSIINKLTNKQTDSAITDIQADQTALGTFVGFFVLGLFILLFMWMFLLCCCCCPSCCPSKCCQKNENQQYTKCQLYWPSIVLILLLLLVIIVGAIGLAKSSTFKDGLSAITCSTTIMFDDMINGNVTKDGQSFFIGVNNLISGINDLNTNMATVSTQLGLLGTGLTTIVTNLGTAKTDIQKVPTNAAANGNAVIQYTTPIANTFNALNPKLDSLFATILGSSGNGGIIGAFYDTIGTTQTTLSGIKTASDGFSTNSGTFGTAISGISTSLGTFKTSIDDLNKGLDSGLSVLDAPKEMGTMVIQLFYGVSLGVAILALLGVILMTFCDKYKCRYLMYFACLILFFFGLLGFLIAIVFSILVPLLYWGCDWLTYTFSSPTNFSSNVGGLITDATVRGYIMPCINGGTGDLFGAVAPGSVADINNLKNSIINTNLFNTSSQAAALSASIATIGTTIDNFVKGVTPDVIDPTAVGSIVSLSNAPTFNGACPTLAADSWVLSLANTSFTSCKVGGAGVTAPACSTSANLQINGAPCTGCMDTSVIFNTAYTGASLVAGSVLTDMTARYNPGVNVCAATFVTLFGNVWDNYFLPKITAMIPIQTRWVTATTGAAALNTIVTANLATINTTMTTAINALNTAVDSIVDPKYGMIAGLNCKIIGQDLLTVIGAVCISNFNTIYITRLLMGVGAFGILFALCCIVCSGVRHFKHSERKEKVTPSFVNDKNSFENTDAAFRP